MAKANKDGKQTSGRQATGKAGGEQRNAAASNPGTQSSANAGGNTGSNDAMEQRVIAFAEQLGRIVGTVQAKAEGWMDRDALNKQIAEVRDGAANLLEQLSDGVTNMTGAASTATGSGAASKGTRTGAPSKATGTGAAEAPAATGGSASRSRGAVDAPGKKHRKPAPKDPRAIAADARSANMRGAKASMKTTKKRGRG